MTTTPNLRLVDSEVQLCWGEACAEFLADLKLQNLSPRTIEWYGYVLEPFSRWLAETTAGDDPASVTEPHVRAFLEQMKSQGAAGRKPVGPGRLNQYRAGLKSFFDWLCEHSYAAHNPAAGVPKMREPRRVIHTLDADQVRALLEQPDLRRMIGHRDRCFLLLLLDTGLRLSEALGLRVETVDLEVGTAKVLGKGSKERVVGLSAGLVSELRAYLRRRQQALEDIGHPECPWLFPSNVGSRLCAKTVEQFVRRYGVAAGIDPTRVRLSPHTLRHTYAVTFVRSGGDPFTLQKVLGHSSLDTSRRYCNLAGEDVQRRMRDFSPVAALGLASVRKTRFRRPKAHLNAGGRRESGRDSS